MIFVESLIIASETKKKSETESFLGSNSTKISIFKKR